MPDTRTANRQRNLGGLVGVLLLAIALTYHFFPQMFHVDPDEMTSQPHTVVRTSYLPGSAATSHAAGETLDELEAGPPLTKAPAAVIAARQADRYRVLPEQKTSDTPEVAALLIRAANLLQQDRVDSPAGNNALEVYRQVQRLDPQNAVAAQGLLRVQRAVLDRALTAIAQNDYEAAGKALSKATTIVADTPQLQETKQRIYELRHQYAEVLLAQACAALDAGDPVLAGRLAKQAQVVAPNLAGMQDFKTRLLYARLYAGYRPGQVFSDHYMDRVGQAPVMVVIPVGSFLMGARSGERGSSEAELPQHRVILTKGFAMSRTSITVGQFRAFVRASGYQPDSIRLGGANIYDERSGSMREDTSANWQDDYAGRRATDEFPVVNVSWNDATAYAKWLSERTGNDYRLPSEAEFEYALRGGTTSRYWWGRARPKRKVENLTGSLDRSPSGRRWKHAFAGYGDGYWGPAPVMRFQPNPFGLYDIDGNVAAWVQDCWHDNYNMASQDGSAWINPGCQRRVVRGGSWSSSPLQERSAYRQGLDSMIRSGRVGFRVVREF